MNKKTFEQRSRANVVGVTEEQLSTLPSEALTEEEVTRLQQEIKNIKPLNTRTRKRQKISPAHR